MNRGGGLLLLGRRHDSAALLRGAAASDDAMSDLWLVGEWFAPLLAEAARGVMFSDMHFNDTPNEPVYHQFIDRFVTTALRSPRDLTVAWEEPFTDTGESEQCIEMLLRHPQCDERILVALALSPAARRVLSKSVQPSWAEVVVTVYGRYVLQHRIGPLDIKDIVPFGAEFDPSATRALLSGAYTQQRLTKAAEDYFFARWTEMTWMRKKSAHVR